MAAGGKTKRLYLHLQGEIQYIYYTFGSVHDSDDDGVVGTFEINYMAQLFIIPLPECNDILVCTGNKNKVFSADTESKIHNNMYTSLW